MRRNEAEMKQEKKKIRTGHKEREQGKQGEEERGNKDV